MRKRHPEKNSCSFVYIYGTGSVQYPLWKRKREKDRERERERDRERTGKTAVL